MATVKVTEQKVILCGEYGVGKTSIFRRFANNTFVASSDRKSTLGLDNIDKEYVVEDRRIRVSIQSYVHQSFFYFENAKHLILIGNYIRKKHFVSFSFYYYVKLSLCEFYHIKFIFILFSVLLN